MDKKDIKTNTEELQAQIIMPANSIMQKKWICDVCGHANPEYTALCKKCSNYLQRS